MKPHLDTQVELEEETDSKCLLVDIRIRLAISRS